MRRSRVAVIGAGMAGLACAAVLRREGVETVIYDKGRGPGGRASSRRTPFGRFDHGAQFFTVRDDGFRRVVDDWHAAGLVAPWKGRFVAVRKDGITPLDDETRYVGVPKMNAFLAHEADEAGVEFGLKMGPPRREAPDGPWILQGENGQSAWSADWVVFATPAEQAAMLLQGVGSYGSQTLAAEATHAVTAPTWTLMAAFEERGTPPPFDAAKIETGPLAFVGRELSRPGREGPPRFVAHATQEWSRDHLEEAPEAILPVLTKALCDIIGETAPCFAELHRWRYAYVAKPAQGPFGLDEAAGLATCGDWRIAPRLESAWVSGNALGRALLERL